MKKIVFTILLTMFLVNANCQMFPESINFDDNVNLFRIRIDSTIPNNIWQIGAPYKHIFLAAHSIPNAIVTDTLNPYPINNTSVFYLTTPGDYFSKMHAATLNFWYRLDNDTLIDYGKIEISIGSSNTWKNIAAGNGLNGYYEIYDSLWNLIKQTNSFDTLVFTGTSNGWYKFTYYKDLPESQFYDSIRYRFTFHSSSIFANKDGWMIDDIQFQDFWESSFEKRQDYNVYPNPIKEYLNITSKEMVVEYEIMNSIGEVLERNKNDQLQAHINVSYLTPGFYLYKFKFLNGQLCLGKFIKI